MTTITCSQCGETCAADDGYSDCCNEPVQYGSAVQS
jgi:hypothetical protein